MAFLSSILHTSVVRLVVLLATMAVARPTKSSAAGFTAKERSGGRSPAVPATAAANDGPDNYICYLCHKRNTLMIKCCPLDKDDCHVACLSDRNGDDGDGNPPVHVLEDDDRSSHECYVMKLYPDGSWVIVDVVSCKKAGGCSLFCSYSDVEGKDAIGVGITPAASRPPLPPLVADFERCGDQVRTDVTGGL